MSRLRFWMYSVSSLFEVGALLVICFGIGFLVAQAYRKQTDNIIIFNTNVARKMVTCEGAALGVKRRRPCSTGNGTFLETCVKIDQTHADWKAENNACE